MCKWSTFNTCLIITVWEPRSFISSKIIIKYAPAHTTYVMLCISYIVLCAVPRSANEMTEELAKWVASTLRIDQIPLTFFKFIQLSTFIVERTSFKLCS